MVVNAITLPVNYKSNASHSTFLTDETQSKCKKPRRVQTLLIDSHVGDIHSNDTDKTTMQQLQETTPPKGGTCHYSPVIVNEN